MELLRGMRDKLDQYIDISSEFYIEMRITGSAIYDFCCFGVDEAGSLSDDRYMIFYNQPASPDNEIRFVSGENSSGFYINLSKLPANVDRLVFTASIDGNGTMGEIVEHYFSLSQNNCTLISMKLSGSDFKREKAIISIELYRKGSWRISAVANGFNGGLSALLKYFGGEEILPDASETDAASQQQEDKAAVGVSQKKDEKELTQEVMGKIRLSKDKVNLEKHVVSLSKCIVDLSKKSGIDLGSAKAKVVVVLDYSGSMSNLYSNGTVQRTLNRLVPLGLTFDDNGAIDIYLFQSNYKKLADLNLSNYDNYVQNVIQTSGYGMGGTRYAPVLKAIIEGDSYKQGGFLGFGGKTVTAEPIVDDTDATFILFITDGENADRAETDQIIVKSSGMNVFIQFIGIGNEKFQYLKKLDDMPGRVRDNTGFTRMKDLDRADDNELYTNVLDQFAKWLRGLQ